MALVGSREFLSSQGTVYDSDGRLIVSGLSTPPAVTQANGTDPAANTEISEAVPASRRWLLKAVSVSLAQAGVQTPQPILIIDDGSDVIYESFGSSAVQAVNTTTRYTWAPGLSLTGQVGATTNVHSTAPLLDNLVLEAGYRIRTSTIGIGANSDYGVPSLYYVEYVV